MLLKTGLHKHKSESFSHTNEKVETESEGCGHSWWPSWLGRGAVINVNAPGCGTSVVRGPTGHK